MKDERINHLINFLFVLTLLFFGIILLNRLFLSFSYETNLGGVEESFIYFIQRTLLDLKLYSLPEKPPYFLNQYGPVYFELINSIYDLVGINAEDVRQIFVTGRLMQVFWNLGTSAIIFLIINKAFHIKWRVAVLFSLLSFVIFFPHHYAIRPDSMKSFTVLLSFFLLVQGCNTNQYRYLIFAGVVAAISVFVKQDALAFAGLYAFFLFMTQQWLRSLLYYLSSFLISFLILLGISGVAYGTEEVYQNLVVGNSQGISFAWYNGFLRDIYHFVYLFALIAFVIFMNWQELNKLEKNVAIVTVSAVLIQLASGLKWGSASVYITESILFIFIVCAIFINRYNLKHIYVLTAVLPLVVLVEFTMTTSNSNKRWYNPGVQESLKLRQQEWQSLSEVISNKKPNSNIYVQHKGALPYFPSKAIFPTYEDEFAHYRFCVEGSREKLVESMGAPQKIFDYSNWKKEIGNKTDNVLLLHKSQCKLPPLFGPPESHTILIDEEGYQLRSMSL